MDNRYNRHNRRKYSLKVHIVLVAKYRKRLLKGTIADDAKQKIFDICNSNGWNIIAMETDKDHIHFLVSYEKKRLFLLFSVLRIVKRDEMCHNIKNRAAARAASSDENETGKNPGKSGIRQKEGEKLPKRTPAVKQNRIKAERTRKPRSAGRSFRG